MSISFSNAYTCPLYCCVGSYTGCVGGCDGTLTELLDLKDLTRLPTESGINSLFPLVKMAVSWRHEIPLVVLVSRQCISSILCCSF